MHSSLPRALVLATLIGVWPVAAGAQSSSPSSPPAANPGPSQVPAPTTPAEPSASPAEPGMPPGAVTSTPCNTPEQHWLGAPANTPPAGMTFVWTLILCFDAQGGSPTIEPDAY